MTDKVNGSDRDPKQVQNKNSGSVLNKAIEAVAAAFKNGADAAMAHQSEPRYEPADRPASAELRDSNDGKVDDRDTVIYTFEPVQDPEKNSTQKKKKKEKKQKKKSKKLEKALEKKLEKKKKKALKKVKKQGEPSGSPVDREHPFNEAGPYGPGGL